VVGVPTGAYLAGTPPTDQRMTTVVDDDADGAVAAAGDVAPVLRGGADAILWCKSPSQSAVACNVYCRSSLTGCLRLQTSIQQGGVASRAGNLYDAIIGRRL